MKILKDSDYQLMIDTIIEQDEELKKALKLLKLGQDIVKSLKAENDYLRSLNNVSNINFPNTEERSTDDFGGIDINDIFKN